MLICACTFCLRAVYDFQEANDRGCGNNEVFGNW
jgi:hypothetical protein